MAFYNIFSDKKEKTEENRISIPIIIDLREKNSLLPSELASLGFQIEFKHLEIADYILNNTIAIERKTITDFKSSIINKRIISQLENLKQYPTPILLLEGFTPESVSEGIIHENAFRGLILSVLLSYKIPIIFTKDEKDSAKYIAVLAKKLEKEPAAPALALKRIASSPEEQKQIILESFPGIGPATAKSLLKEFKSIKKIISTSSNKLKKVLGKKSDKFIQLLE